MAPRFLRRREIDYEKLAKALSPAIMQAAQNSRGSVQPNPQSMTGTSGGPYAALPRPDDQFDSGFGPNYPLWPDPIDALGPNGRTAPRRSQYLVSWNLQLVDRQVPWTLLRWLAEDCDVVNRCVQLKQDEVVGYEWSWGYSDQILNQIMLETGESNTARATAIARDKYGDELTRVQQFFEKPDRDMSQTFSDWLQALMWDHLVYDGVAIYPGHNLDGTLRNLELVDAATIKLYRDNRGRIPQAPAPAYAQILYGFPRGEFQHVPEEADDEFGSDQLSYYIRRPRNTSVYGYPQVEEVMALATTYLARQEWMRAEYTSGAMPKTFMEVATGNIGWSPEQLSGYETTMNDRFMGQTERRQGFIMLPEGFHPTFAPQLDEHYKSDYDNWLIGQIGSRFGIAASSLGVQAKAGLSGGKQSQGEQQQVEAYSTKAMMNWIVDVVNDLAQKYLGAGPEITLRYNGGGTDEDHLNEITADLALVNSGVITRNEQRAKQGIPLSDDNEADQLAVTTATGITFLSGTFEAQELKQAAPPVPPPVAPGQIPPAPDGSTPPPPDETKPAPKPDDTDPPKADPVAPAKIDPPGKTKPKAKKSEADAYRRFMAKGETREFRWYHHTPEEVDELLGKAPAQSDWAKHPNHKYHALLVDHYAPKLAEALKSGTNGIHSAITTAKAKLGKSVTDDAATGAVSQTVTISTEQLRQILANLYSESAMAGAHVAQTGGVSLTADMEAVTSDINWATWKPGNPNAAALVNGERLQALMESQDVTIQGISDSAISRLGNLLADGLASGDSVSTIARSMTDDEISPDRAAVIANTETARAMTAASFDTMTAAGVEQFNWFAEDDACPECEDMADNNPHDVGDDGPPAHPSCRCAAQAIVDTGESDSEDDEG